MCIPRGWDVWRILLALLAKKAITVKGHWILVVFRIQQHRSRRYAHPAALWNMQAILEGVWNQGFTPHRDYHGLLAIALVMCGRGGSPHLYLPDGVAMTPSGSYP